MMLHRSFKVISSRSIYNKINIVNRDLSSNNYSTNSSNTNPKKSKKWRKLFFASLLGLGIGGGLIMYESNEDGTFGPNTVSVLQKIPLRYTSHVWGKFTKKEIPPFLLMPILKCYSRVYHCNLDEMVEPLHSYKCIQDFFVRRLHAHTRPFVDHGIASPVDGKIMSIHQVTNDEISSHAEQIKGITYSLTEFLGSSIDLRNQLTEDTKDDESNKTNLYHCIIYLAPGDYHGIHSPVDWEITERTFFPGQLFPVAPVVVKKLQNLLGMNERAILTGSWEHGYFSLSPVGATNVGSISLSHEPEFETNLREHHGEIGKSFTKNYINDDTPNGISYKRGDEIAFFNMGSTVVLVFESPPLEFDVKPGDSVKMGSSLAHFIIKE